MNRNVVVDLDGVIADFEKKFCDRFGSDRREEFSLEKRYPSDIEEISEFVNSPSTYANLDVIPLGMDILKYLDRKGFEISLVSYRPDEAFGITFSWLKNNRIPFFSLSAERKRDKISRIQSISPIFAIDDSGEIAEKLKEISIPTILIAQAWNRSFSGKFPRIANFSQFLTQFHRITGE